MTSTDVHRSRRKPPGIDGIGGIDGIDQVVRTARESAAPVALRFVPTPRLRRLAMIAGLSLLAAVASGHGELLVLAVAPLVLLALSPRSRLPVGLEVGAVLSQSHCVEGDELVLVLACRGSGFDRVVAVPELAPRTIATCLTRARDRDGAAGEASDLVACWRVVPGRWGRYPAGRVRLTATAVGGSYQARAACDLRTLTGGDLVVYPTAAALARAVAPLELAAPLGEHPSRAAGAGVEFAGVRPYGHGDRQRDVDWRVSARHGELFVRQYAAERAFDLVLVLDTAVDAGSPAGGPEALGGSSSLDLTVRAATGLAQSYLRAHDRVGLVTFGGPLRWLAPATGPRQLRAVCEAVLSTRPGESPDDRDAGRVQYGLEHLPRGLLPSRAFVAVITPLLDDGALNAVRLIRDRGFAPLVVDVLRSDPGPPRRRRDRSGDLALRVWRLHRAALKAELGLLGVAVLDWDGDAELTGGLQQAMRAARPGARP